MKATQETPERKYQLKAKPNIVKERLVMLAIERALKEEKEQNPPEEEEE